MAQRGHALRKCSPTPTPTETITRKLWALVPARRGSVGVPDKNIRPLGSACLIERAIQVAGYLGAELVISSDYPKHLIRCPPTVLFLDRPSHLASHDASMWDVVADVARTLHWGKSDTIVLLQPTSLHHDRSGVVRAMLEEDRLPIVSVDRFPDKWHPWYALAPGCHNYPPTSRHGLPARYRSNGLAYIMSGDTARRGNFWQDCPKLHEVEGVLNIDSQTEWAEAVRLYG